MWFCSQQEIVIRQIGEVWNDTIGEKPSYGRKWRAGDQCAAASMSVSIISAVGADSYCRSTNIHNNGGAV